jgi:DNA invertase Pin-like site-specific DNA recombinase
MKIGYARVSKDEQDLAPQLHALDAAGCGKVFQDQGWSGASAARPGLLAALAGEGDTLTVWRIDRLGRSTLHLLQILEDLHRRNIAFQSIMDGIDTNTAGGPHGVLDGKRHGGIRAQRDFRADKGGHGGGAAARSACGPSGKTRVPPRLM